MTTLNDLFIEYLASIQPYSKAVERAQLAHTCLREDLEGDESLGAHMLNSLLSGSYGRSTAIKGIKDVDVVIPFNYSFEELSKLCQSNETTQHCLLRLVREAIERSGRLVESSTIRRRSILVKLTDAVNGVADDEPDLTLDIVPVIPQIYKSGELDQYTDPLWIADKDLDQWLSTYPNSQLSDSESRNEESSYLVDRHHYKPLVKIMKAWKKVHFGSQKTPKGFFLECMVAEFHNPDAESWILALRDMLKNACDTWGNPEYFIASPTVADISKSSANRIPLVKVEKPEDLDRAKNIVKKMRRHLELIEQAIDEADSDLNKAARTLELVLGSDPDDIVFPLPQSDKNSSSDSTKKDEPRRVAIPVVTLNNPNKPWGYDGTRINN